MTPSARRWARVAFALALVIGGVLALAPTSTSESCEGLDDGAVVCSSNRESLVDSEGAGIVAALAVPALIAGVPVLFPRPRTVVVSAAVLTAATVVSLASVGMFLLPVTIVEWFAVAATRRSQ